MGGGEEGVESKRGRRCQTQPDPQIPDLYLFHSFCELHTWKPVNRTSVRQLDALMVLTVHLVFEDENFKG